MAGPSVIRFTARLAKNGSGAMLVVPPAIGKKIGGMTKVEGTINSHPFRAPLESNGTGRYTFRVNKAMRAGADADVGDTVRLAILGPQPAPTIPADLRRAMNASKPAKA